MGCWHRKQVGRPARHGWRVVRLLTVLTCVLGAGICVTWRSPDGLPQPYRLMAGGLLLLAGAGQTYLFSRADGCASRGRTRPPAAARVLVRWMAAGTLLLVATHQYLPADPWRPVLAASAIACWGTLLLGLPCLVPWGRESPPRGGWRRAGLCRAAFGLYLVILALATTEFVLRSYRLLSARGVLRAVAPENLKLPPGQTWDGRRVNALGYWDDEFQSLRHSGLYRVAVLGDEMVLSGGAGSNCLDRLEQNLEGVEVYNFGLPRAGPPQYVAQLMREVVHFQPDLVLTFLSVSDDFTGDVPRLDESRPQGLLVGQLFARQSDRVRRWLSGQARPRPASPASLRPVESPLAVCRVPRDLAAERRWTNVLRQLETIITECRRREIGVGLVVVPAEFQLNHRLRQQLRQQGGYAASEIDVSLPQRRLSVFADQQRLPLLDLLPYFQGPAEPLYEPTRPVLSQHANQLAALAVGSWLEARYLDVLAAEDGLPRR